MNVSCDEATRTSAATIAIVLGRHPRRSRRLARAPAGGLGMPHWRSDAETTSTSAPIRYVSRNPRRAAATAPGSGPTSVPITSADWIAPSRRRIDRHVRLPAGDDERQRGEGADGAEHEAREEAAG